MIRPELHTCGFPLYFIVRMLKNLLIKLLYSVSKKILRKYQPKIIGITGSVGKTSTKEAVAVALGAKFSLRQSLKSYNNEIGIPLTIIGAGETPGRSMVGWLVVFGRALGLLISTKVYPEVLVLEMGADKPGDIAYLTRLAPCDVGVLTSISHAHTQAFKTLQQIAREKKIIVTHLAGDAQAVLNFDDDLVVEVGTQSKAPRLTYGFKYGADFQASDAKLIYNPASGWPEGINFKVSSAGHIVPVFLPGVVAEHLIPAALAALAVANACGVNLVDAALALEDLLPCPGRMRLLPGVKHTLVIDDSYNANPSSTLSALHTLADLRIGETARRYAVLGDMLELGTETENAHRAVGFKVAELGVDYLITVGEAAKQLAHAAEEAGHDPDRIATFADATSAARFLQDKLDEGDVVLIKGSRGMHLELVVKEIMADPEQAADVLVQA